MSDWLFAPGYKPEPFWWERSPRPQRALTTMPQRADVVIVGSGFTGLNAAIATARGGRDTLVLDAQSVGWGCSSRNGGQISTSIKPGYDALRTKLGHDVAYGIVREGHDALAWIGEFVANEGIECDFRVAGRFYAAHTPAHFKSLVQQHSQQPKGLETDSRIVPRHEQASEIDSELYHGGVVHPRHAKLDPGRYHLGLLACAEAAGARVVSHCPVSAITGRAGEFTVATAQGVVKARDVVVATSGYTGALTPWQRRRIIPIGSYMLATQVLDDALIRRLIPNDRVISDTRKLVVYYRTCPERKRILFGGRVSINETDPSTAAPALHAQMVRRFPELSQTPITHAWMGFVGYTFDQMPHLGRHQGIHYAMGYCGSGVSLASYFGRKIGLQVLGDADGDSPLSEIPFPGRPYYFGRPWFLAPSIRFYQWYDERGA